MVARGQHHTVERRLLPPRRSDIERRVGERRLELISLEEERRDQAERRHATDRRQPAVPFLFLSDSDDERHGLEAVRAGAQDFLVKGDLDGERLARALRHVIERNRLHAALLDLALVDELTGLYNRRGFLTLATRD